MGTPLSLFLPFGFSLPFSLQTTQNAQSQHTMDVESWRNGVQSHTLVFIVELSSQHTDIYIHVCVCVCIYDCVCVCMYVCKIMDELC